MKVFYNDVWQEVSTSSSVVWSNITDFNSFINQCLT